MRDAERTRQALLAAAEIEFSTKGLAGARVDVIAEQAAANKRMLYYYFGSKEELYLAVLERAYGAMRKAERELNLTNLAPLEAIRTLVEFKFDYCQQHQQIIALLAGENMLGAAYLKRSRRLRDMNLSLVDVIRTVLDAGVATGRDQARDRSVAPVHLDVGAELLLLLQFGDAVGGVRAATGQPGRTAHFGGRMLSMSSWLMSRRPERNRCSAICCKKAENMKFGDYPKAGSLDGVTGFRNYVQSLGIDMPCDDIVAHGPKSPLAAPLEIDGMKIGHRLAIQPMEGWDCERDGKPSENTKRRWRRFGLSGAKLIWGGEACAVRFDGRANPKQLTMTAESQSEIAALRDIARSPRTRRRPATTMTS